MQKHETTHQKELNEAKRELQKAKDEKEVQLKKLRDDLKDYESEMKRAKFVFENYEREVARWRKEVEEGEKEEPLKTDLLQVPEKKTGRRHRCSSHRSNGSRQASRSPSQKGSCDRKPFKRINRRVSKGKKENDGLQSNLNIVENTTTTVDKENSKPKSLKPKGTSILRKTKSSTQNKLKIKRQKSGKRKRIA